MCRVLLRAQLHYEIARCELAKDFLVKAAEHLTSALALDYGGSGKEPEEVTAGAPRLVAVCVRARVCDVCG